jgi:hypothetical protein
MPNNQSKQQFNADFQKALEDHITVCRRMYRQIRAKDQFAYSGDLNHAVGVLQSIKDYAAMNKTRVDRKPLAPITHDALGLKYLNKGKQGIKDLFNGIQANKQTTDIKQGYQKALDVVVVFITQLPVK